MSLNENSETELALAVMDDDGWGCAITSAPEPRPLPPWPPVCRRCKREAHGWPLRRGDRCSPPIWIHCIRDPFTVMNENITEGTRAP